jgi:hypothetical protein
MVLFALGFWYAFSATEYGSNAKPRDKPYPLWRAIIDAVNPIDLLLGVARVPNLFFDLHRSGGWKAFRAVQKNKGVSGAARKAVRKYQNRKGTGSGRYQEVGAGMEELQKPNASHDRSESGVSHVSEQDFMMSGAAHPQELYQPPAGSPPDSDRSHLMAESFESRPRSSSQGPWNGYSYDRAPSPSLRPSMDATQGRDMV